MGEASAVIYPFFCQAIRRAQGSATCRNECCPVSLAKSNPVIILQLANAEISVFLKFPSGIRRFQADLVSADQKGGQVFYRLSFKRQVISCTLCLSVKAALLLLPIFQWSEDPSRAFCHWAMAPGSRPFHESAIRPSAALKNQSPALVLESGNGSKAAMQMTKPVAMSSLCSKLGFRNGMKVNGPRKKTRFALFTNQIRSAKGLCRRESQQADFSFSTVGQPHNFLQGQ